MPGLIFQNRLSSRTACWIGLGLVLLGTLLLRVRMLDIPLERDEGDYAYFAMLMTQGVSPVDEAVRIRFPLISGLYAFFITLFGHTAAGVHAGLLVANLATTLLLFLIGRKLLGPLAGLVAAACFAVLDVSPTVQGFSANREQFLILFVAGGVWMLLKAFDRRRWPLFFLSGVLMGLAFLIKQHGAAFILFGGLYVVAGHVDLRRRAILLKEMLVRGLAYSVGALLCYGLVCLFYLSLGEFQRFWYRTVVYPKSYASSLSFAEGSGQLMERLSAIFLASPVIWCLAMLGLTAAFWSGRVRQHLPLLVGLAAFSLLSIMPGFYFRPHYFVLILPAAALLAACGVESLRGAFKARLPAAWGRPVLAILVVLAVATPIHGQRQYLVESTLFEAYRHTYELNPFWAAREVGEYLKEQTTPEDRILILGSEPEILFYAERMSVTKHVYMYDLMYGTETADRIQEELIAAAERHRPSHVVLVDVSTSWLVRPESSMRVFEWWVEFQKQYELVAFWKILPDGPRRVTGELLESIDEGKPFSIMVFRRVP
ncbi:MAG: glycosyltransferase family 39 protein [Planctomycetota bacterium]